MYSLAIAAYFLVIMLRAEIAITIEPPKTHRLDANQLCVLLS
jgi:hypothetical protein